VAKWGVKLNKCQVYGVQTKFNACDLTPAFQLSYAWLFVQSFFRAELKPDTEYTFQIMFYVAVYKHKICTDTPSTY
jgi:hypothetical protein